MELVRSSGRPIAEVARSLGIAEGTLWNWVRAERDADSLEPAIRMRCRSPNATSCLGCASRNIELQTDKEILRRAAAYFARETMR